jgi:hypothetical protein
MRLSLQVPIHQDHEQGLDFGGTFSEINIILFSVSLSLAKVCVDEGK